MDQPTGPAAMPPPAASGIGAPVGYKLFRNVWCAGVFSTGR
jgi:hypothetical protein